VEGTNELVAVVDLSDLTAGAHVVELTEDHLKLPGAISLSGIEPRRIRVSTRTQATEPAAIDE
jgi:hypothetical protein